MAAERQLVTTRSSISHDRRLYSKSTSCIARECHEKLTDHDNLSYKREMKSLDLHVESGQTDYCNHLTHAPSRGLINNLFVLYTFSKMYIVRVGQCCFNYDNYRGTYGNSQYILEKNNLFVLYTSSKNIYCEGRAMLL